MLLVRAELTKILLEVTNEKIQEISSETLSKYRRKGICEIRNYLLITVIHWDTKSTFTKKQSFAKLNYWELSLRQESGVRICEKSLATTRHVAELLFLY